MQTQRYITRGSHFAPESKQEVAPAKKRPLAMVVAIVAIALAAVGGTVAWIATHTEPVLNTFTPGVVTCSVVEDSFYGVKKENVKVANTGNTDAFIRAYFVASWQDDNGNTYGMQPQSTDYYVALSSSATEAGSKWLVGSDGYYYFTVPVAPDGLTDVLIKEAALNSSAIVPEGYHLTIEVIAEAIQADGVSAAGVPAATDAWGVTVESRTITAVPGATA